MQQFHLVFLFVVLLGTVILGALVVFRLWRSGRGSPDHRSGLCLLGTVGLLALALRLGCMPAMHHVYYDEFTYIAEARNIVGFGKAGQVLAGTISDPEITSSATARVGFPLLLASVAAISPEAASDQFWTEDGGIRWLFRFNILLGALSVAMLFQIIRRATGSLRLSFWSAAVLALLPAHIKYSASLSADTAVLFFFLLSIMCLLEWGNSRERLYFITALFAGAYSSAIKPLYLPFLIIGLAAVVCPKYHRKELSTAELLDLLYYAGCLVLPMSLILIPYASLEMQAHSGSFYSVDYLKKHVWVNWKCLFNKSQFNLVASIFLVIGMMSGRIRRREAFPLGMVVWFWLGFLLLAGYYAGGISNRQYTDSDRFFFTVAMPFSFLAACGVEAVTGWVLRKNSSAVGLVSLLIFLLLLWGCVYPCGRVVSATRKRYVYQQLCFLKKVAPTLPPDVYMVDPDSVFISTVTFRKAIRADLFYSGYRPCRVVYFSTVGGRGAAPDNSQLERVIRRNYSCGLWALFYAESDPDTKIRAFLCDRCMEARR